MNIHFHASNKPRAQKALEELKSRYGDVSSEKADVIVVLGHNHNPPVPHLGSAIFLHIAKPGYGPTEGCAALAQTDLLAILAEARAGDLLCFAVDDRDVAPLI